MPRVSLVWGCELKDPEQKQKQDKKKVSLVWGCELKDLWCLRVRLLTKVSLVWGCELKDHRRPFHMEGNMVSLVWGCELKETIVFVTLMTTRSASYEAVNWKMQWLNIQKNRKRSASYEAVNWKTTKKEAREAGKGQPRMRLWIERMMPLLKNVPIAGQPRMRLWIERFR